MAGKIKLTYSQRRQLQGLQVRPWRGGITNPTMCALEKRGLAEFKTEGGWGNGTWSLTDAGKQHLKDNPHG